MRLTRKGKIAFIGLRDEGREIQLVLSRDRTGDYEDIKLLDRGDYIGVEGTAYVSQSGERSLLIVRWKLLAKSLRPLPSPKSETGPDGGVTVHNDFSNKEIRYRKRHLDLLLNGETRKTFVIRARIISSIREYLDGRGFLEVQTPILQNQYGGANAQPFRTKYNALDRDVFLRISNELYLKQCLMGGLNRVYEIGKDFRNEGTDRTHNPEFTMIEFYEAYGDYRDMMVHFENIFHETSLKLFGTSVITYEGREIDLRPPWKRMTFYEAIGSYTPLTPGRSSREELETYLTGEEIDYQPGDTTGKLWIRLFEERVESLLIQPHIIYDYPKESTPLCKIHRENPELVEQFEPYINGWEMGNAYTELNDPLRQRELLSAQADSGRGGEEDHPADEVFLEAMEYGMPPAGGVGIGIDRMVMLFTGSRHIKDVILFPLLR